MAKEDIKKYEYDSDQSRTKAAQNGRKGGIASGKAKREKKAMRETLETLLTMPLDNSQLDDLEGIQSLANLKGKNITVQEAIMFAQVKRAMKGDARAVEFIRDTIGQKPTDKMNIDMRLPVFFEGEEDLEE